MKEVIVKFEPFVFKQTIFIKDEEGNISQEKVTQKDLASYISLLDDINKVHFFGSEAYATKIKEECLTKYNLNNVEIVINK